MKLGSFLLALCGLLVACRQESSLFEFADRVSFEAFGGTFFSTAQELSVKEILLNAGTFGQESIIVEGTILRVDGDGAYLVLKDDESKLLVLTVSLDFERAGVEGRQVRVLGVIESGKYGAPVLRARSLKQS